MTAEEEVVTAPMDSDLYITLEPLVYSIASSEWKNSHVYTIEDVAQAIWEHMMANWSQYEPANEFLFRHMARRAARGFCERERVKYMYANGAFLYTPGMVRHYLEDVVWCSPEDCRDVDARVDLSEAIQKLTKGQKVVLYKKYGLKEPLTKGSEQVAESRAVSSITNRLNTGLRMQSGGIEE